MAFLNLNGTDMPPPASFSVVLQDLDSDSTKRNEQGVLQRDRVRQGVRKLSCKWTALSFSDAAMVLGATVPDAFNATYIDPATGGYRSATVYVGDRSSDMQATATGQRWNISFDLIEY